MATDQPDRANRLIVLGDIFWENIVSDRVQHKTIDLILERTNLYYNEPKPDNYVHLHIHQKLFS